MSTYFVVGTLEQGVEVTAHVFSLADFINADADSDIFVTQTRQDDNGEFEESQTTVVKRDVKWTSIEPIF